MQKLLGPLKISQRNRITVPGSADFRFLNYFCVLDEIMVVVSIAKICLILADKFMKSLNILAAVHSVLWSALNFTVITTLLCSLFCLFWSSWLWLMSVLHITYNLLFPVEHAIQILKRNLLASKAVINRHCSSNNYIWWMKFVCYLALSMYFIEIIVSIMFHKKKLVYEWEPCLRENVHTQ